MHIITVSKYLIKGSFEFYQMFNWLWWPDTQYLNSYPITHKYIYVSLFHKISTFRWFLKILYETFPSCILTPAPCGLNASLSIQVTNIDQNTPPWSTASRPSTPRFTVGMETTFYSKFIRNIHVDDSYKSSNFTYILPWHTKSKITLILINLSL